MRLIDGDELCKKMYHEAFEIDSDEQRWDSGCWIRYKMFERVIESMPSAQHEITEDEVKEWLHKRYLVVMDAALYGDMKSRCAGCVYEPIEGVRSIVEHGCAIIPGSGSNKRDHPECGKD